jgi:hypothetical protein
VSSDALILKLVGEVSEKIGALQRDVERMAEQGESIGTQHTFLLEQQGKILDEIARHAREVVDLRERVVKLESEPPAPIHPHRERAPSITTEAREKQTESMRVAADAMQSTARANKWTPWLVAAAVTAGTFFSTLVNSCALIPHH